MSNDDLVIISWDITSDENDKLRNIYIDTLQERGLSPEDYDFDKFMREVIDFYIDSHEN